DGGAGRRRCASRRLPTQAAGRRPRRSGGRALQRPGQGATLSVSLELRELPCFTARGTFTFTCNCEALHVPGAVSGRDLRRHGSDEAPVANPILTLGKPEERDPDLRENVLLTQIDK